MPSNDQIILDDVIDQDRKRRAPSWSPTEFFELFVAGQILKDFDLNDEELETGIVAGGGDGGIDGAFLFANGELVLEDFDLDVLRRNIRLDVFIIQAKTSTSFSESAISKFETTIRDLFNFSNLTDSLAEAYNADVRAFADRFRALYREVAAKFPTLNFNFVYATKGNSGEVHPNVYRRVNLLKEGVTQLFSDAATSLHFLGANDLLALARKMPITSFDIQVANTISTEVGYIALVKLREYFKFIKGEDEKLRIGLFEANVRDYQGTNSVNEDMQKTLQDNSGEDFWWFNNGVTILASRAVLSGRTLSIENPQIVNGLQTSTEIFNHFSSTVAGADARELLVRVIFVQDPETNDKIIKATNSQTPIPSASLRATDKIHRDIEDYLRPYGLSYDRRKNQYRNRGISPAKIVSIPLMAQAIMSTCLGRPNDARARPSSLLKKDGDYQEIFNPQYPINVFLIAARIIKCVQDHLNGRDDIVRKDRNNIQFHASAVVSSLLTGKRQPTASDLSRFDVKCISDELVTRGVSIAHSVYAELGSTDQIAKSHDFVRNLGEAISSQLVS